MAFFDGGKDPFTAENGWLNFETLVQGIDRSIQAAQEKLAETEDQDFHLMIKDVRLDISVELHLDPDSGMIRVRLPAVAKRLGEDPQDGQLSRIQFTLGHVIRHRSL